MADVSIQIRENGPLLVSGSIELTDTEGKPYPLDPEKTIALCRCGQSANRPFCDGAHKGVFVSCDRVPPSETD